MHSLINMALRGGTLLFKFVLVFMLAKLLDPAQVGMYGLIASGVGYSLYIVGIDFYTYTSRELLKVERKTWGRMLKSHLFLAFSAYIFFLTLVVCCVAIGALDPTVASWVAVLVLLEYFAQEQVRLHVFLLEPLLASSLMFIRQGGWGVCAILYMYFFESARSLKTVLIFWTASCILSSAISVACIFKSKISGWQESVDWDWVRRGMAVSLAYLVGTLAIKAILSLDRFFFSEMNNVEALGAYVLFMGVASALPSFLDAGVFVFGYPRLIEYSHKGNAESFWGVVRSMGAKTLCVVLLFSVLSLPSITYLVGWLSRPIYSQYQELFGWFLVGNIFLSFSMIPHYVLYARGKDRFILVTHILSLVIFVLSVVIVKDYDNVMAVPFAIVMGFVVSLIAKSVYALNLYRIDRSELDQML